MDKIFSDYSSFIIVYIDDMLFCSNNEKDHKKHLNIFITLFKDTWYNPFRKESRNQGKRNTISRHIIDYKGIKLQSHIAEKRRFP